MRIRNMDNMTLAELDVLLASGGRLVFYEYCISLLVLTWRCPSSIHLLRYGQSGISQRLFYTCVSLVLGWWGIPWGFLLTPRALYINLSGGHDVTDEVRRLLSVREDRADVAGSRTGE